MTAAMTQVPVPMTMEDRKGLTLSFEDVKHYGRIIYVLQQTERIMQEIDSIGYNKDAGLK